MTQLAFEAKSPVFSDPRQAGRHRTLPFHGFMGYTPIGSEVYFPEDSEFKMQDRVNRQGRGKDMETSDLDTAKSILRETFDQQAKYVEELEELGASEELIRNVKGVGGFTRVWRTGDANNLAKFLVLRQDKHAQMEVRAYANLVARAMSVHTPEAYASFKSNLIDGMRLSSKEIGVISTLYSKDSLNKDFDFDDVNNFKGAGFVIPVDKDDPSKGKKLGREGEAFKSKLQRILYDF